MASRSDRGYGVAKGIPTLVISACAADDVVAISGFGIFLGITFNEDADALQLALHGPIEVALGLTFGISWGLMAQWLPDKDHPHVNFFRWLILFAGGLIALYGAHLIHYDGAGGLAAILLSLVASMQWRREGWGEHNPVSDIFNKVNTPHRRYVTLKLQQLLYLKIGKDKMRIPVNFADVDNLGTRHIRSDWH